jgi:hypothetical protein
LGVWSHILWQRFEYICKLFVIHLLPDHKAQIIVAVLRRNLKSGCRSHCNDNISASCWDKSKQMQLCAHSQQNIAKVKLLAFLHMFVCPHVTTRESLKNFSWHLIGVLLKFLDPFQLWLKLDSSNGLTCGPMHFHIHIKHNSLWEKCFKHKL